MEQTYPGWEGGASVVVAEVGVAKRLLCFSCKPNTPKNPLVPEIRVKISTKAVAFL